MRLPLAPALRAQPRSRRRERRAAPRRARPTAQFLVVDDNRDAADSLAMLLRLQGAEVRVAYDGPSALDAARASRPDIVLLDIGMPGMDGFEIAAQLRADRALAGTRADRAHRLGSARAPPRDGARRASTTTW